MMRGPLLMLVVLVWMTCLAAAFSCSSQEEYDSTPQQKTPTVTTQSSPHNAQYRTAGQGACADKAHMRLTVQRHSGKEERERVLSASTLLFGTRVERADPYSDEVFYNYATYAYMNGEWVRHHYKAIVAGRIFGGHLEVRDDGEELTVEMFSHGFKLEGEPEKYTDKPLAFARKHTLADYLDHLERSGQTAFKHSLEQALRKRSWYGAKFGMKKLGELDTVFDLVPYGFCLARFTQKERKLTHEDSPFLVFPSKTKLSLPAPL